jgi:sigma-E factor negative regulatory protein RseB
VNVGSASKVFAGAIGILLGPCLVGLAPAQAGVGGGEGDGDGGDSWRAIMLLERAASAATSTNYSGTVMVNSWTQQGGTAQLVDVVNVVGRGLLVRVHSSATQPAGAGFVATDQAPLGSAALNLLAQWYDVRLAGSSEVMGRPAQVVTTVREDGTLAGRFWIDRYTGILLRREVFDHAGNLVRVSVYIGLTLGGSALPVDLPPALVPEPASQATSDDTALEADGWDCPAPTGMTLWDAQALPGDHGGVVHLTYSDGLSTVSVFEQAGRLNEGAIPGFVATTISGIPVAMHSGPPMQVTWSSAGRTFTVVSDDDTDGVDSLVALLPHQPTVPDPSALDRVVSGLSRMAGWVNPFA